MEEAAGVRGRGDVGDTLPCRSGLSGPPFFLSLAPPPPVPEPEPPPVARVTAEFHDEKKRADRDVVPAFQFSSSRLFTSRSRIKKGLQDEKVIHCALGV